MAFQVKFTATKGKPGLRDTAVAAGTAIAGSEAVEVNVDATRLTKGEAMALLDQVKAKIHAGKWPPL